MFDDRDQIYAGMKQKIKEKEGTEESKIETYYHIDKMRHDEYEKAIAARKRELAEQAVQEKDKGNLNKVKEAELSTELKEINKYQQKMNHDFALASGKALNAQTKQQAAQLQSATTRVSESLQNLLQQQQQEAGRNTMGNNTLGRDTPAMNTPAKGGPQKK